MSEREYPDFAIRNPFGSRYSGFFRHFPLLANSEGNPTDHFLAEAVLEPIQDLVTPVADDFIQPRAVIDVHDKGSISQCYGLCVGRDIGIDQVIPNFDDFGLGTAAV